LCRDTEGKLAGLCRAALGNSNTEEGYKKYGVHPGSIILRAKQANPKTKKKWKGDSETLWNCDVLFKTRVLGSGQSSRRSGAGEQAFEYAIALLQKNPSFLTAPVPATPVQVPSPPAVVPLQAPVGAFASVPVCSDPRCTNTEELETDEDNPTDAYCQSCWEVYDTPKVEAEVPLHGQSPMLGKINLSGALVSTDLQQYRHQHQQQQHSWDEPSTAEEIDAQITAHWQGSSGTNQAAAVVGAPLNTPEMFGAQLPGLSAGAASFMMPGGEATPVAVGSGAGVGMVAANSVSAVGVAAIHTPSRGEGSDWMVGGGDDHAPSDWMTKDILGGSGLLQWDADATSDVGSVVGVGGAGAGSRVVVGAGAVGGAASDAGRTAQQQSSWSVQKAEEEQVPLAGQQDWDERPMQQPASAPSDWSAANDAPLQDVPVSSWSSRHPPQPKVGSSQQWSTQQPPPAW
jgi:hypothetical protein